MWNTAKKGPTNLVPTSISNGRHTIGIMADHHRDIGLDTLGLRMPGMGYSFASQRQLWFHKNEGRGV